MHPRDLGPYALHMQRLIVLAAVCTTILSGPQLIPASASPSDLAQWVFYSPNLILPLCAGACALSAIIKAVTARRHTHMWTDTGWFILTRLYLACYLALIVACAILPAMHLGSPVPPFYVHAIASDTNPILALYPLAAISSIAVLRGRYTAAYLSVIAPLQIIAMMSANPDNKLLETSVGPLYFLLVAMANAGMLEWTLMIVRGLDQTRSNARDAERALAGECAQGRARSRSNGLIHDYVLSALILACQRGIDNSEVRAAAHSALCALVPDPPSNGFMDAAQMRGAFEALVRPQQSRWRVTCRLPAQGWQIPAQVGTALVSATHEALNNVRLHAGSDTSDPTQPARCRVVVSAGADSIRVTITARRPAAQRPCDGGLHTRDDHRHGTGLRPRTPRRGASRRSPLHRQSDGVGQGTRNPGLATRRRDVRDPGMARPPESTLPAAAGDSLRVRVAAPRGYA